MEASDFGRVYHGVVQEVLEYATPQMQKELSLHNAAWSEGHTDFAAYLEKSVVRFERAYGELERIGATSVCDVGGFWGVWPVTLKRMGVDIVQMTEAKRFYSGAFDQLFAFIEREGVSILDADPFTDSLEDGSFDLVTAMAVLEHYPHSPRFFMENLVSVCAVHGVIYLEVPNIAYWPKRVGLLRGRSPNPPIESVYASVVPFTGHHREYTLRDMHTLASLSGLTVDRSQLYSYSPGFSKGWAGVRSKLENLPLVLALRWVPTARECIALSLSKPSAEQVPQVCGVDEHLECQQSGGG